MAANFRQPRSQAAPLADNSKEFSDVDNNSDGTNDTKSEIGGVFRGVVAAAPAEPPQRAVGSVGSGSHRPLAFTSEGAVSGNNTTIAGRTRNAPQKRMLIVPLLLLSLITITQSWAVKRDLCRRVIPLSYPRQRTQRRGSAMTPSNNCCNNVHDKRRTRRLHMGGYYEEPSFDENENVFGPRRRKRVAFDHMVFGLPCRERRIDLKVPDLENGNASAVLFIVLESVTEPNNADRNTSTMRLAKHIIDSKEKLVSGKKVLVIGASWISLLVSRVGAASVLVWDETGNEARLQLLEHADRFINEDKTAGMCDIRTTTDVADLESEHGSDGYVDVDTAIIAVESQIEGDYVYVDDLLSRTEGDYVYINDFLRHTEAKILLDTDLHDAFNYYTRIQEGADISLW